MGIFDSIFGGKKRALKEYKKSIQLFIDEMEKIPEWYDIIQARGNAHAMLFEAMNIEVNDYEYWTEAHREEYVLKYEGGELDVDALKLRKDKFFIIYKELAKVITKAAELKIQIAQEMANDYYAARASIGGLNRAIAEITIKQNTKKESESFKEAKKIKYDYSDVRILKKQLLESKPKIRYEMGWDNYFVIQLKNNVLVDELDLVECDGDDETVKLAISEFVDFSEEIAPNKNKKFYKGRITLFETRIQNYDSLIALIDNYLEETNEFSYDDFMNWYLDYSADNIFMGETSKLMVGETNISADKFFSFAKTQFGGYESIHRMDINIDSTKNDNEQSNQEKIKNFSEFKTAIKSKLNSKEKIDIEFYMYKYDVIEKVETYDEKWRGIDYTLSWDDYLKDAEFSFAEGITDFYDIIKDFSSLDELKGDDFDLYLNVEYGGYSDNFKIEWQKELTDEESKQFEEYGGVQQLHRDSDKYDNVDVIKGRISRIVVNIGDNESIEISA